MKKKLNRENTVENTVSQKAVKEEENNSIKVASSIDTHTHKKGGGKFALPD